MCRGAGAGCAGGLGARAEKVDLLEFLSFRDETGVTPWRMPRAEGTRIFTATAAAHHVAVGDGLGYHGFRDALRAVSEYLDKPLALLLGIHPPPPPPPPPIRQGVEVEGGH